jgi:hypothetical protein
MSMKKLLAIVAVGTVLAGPAFAQQAQSTHRGARAAHPQYSTRVQPYEPEVYQRPRYEYNNNANPDFQLGGSW